MENAKRLININLPLERGEYITAYGDGYVTITDTLSGDVTRKSVCSVRHDGTLFVGLAPTKSNFLHRQKDDEEFYWECVKHSQRLAHANQYNFRWRESTPTVYVNGDYSPLSDTLNRIRETEEHLCYLQTGGPF